MTASSIFLDDEAGGPVCDAQSEACNPPGGDENTTASFFRYSSVSTLFPPTAAPAVEQFASWMSIALLLIFILLLRSVAAPFLNPLGEPRKATASSAYLSITTFVYCWLVSATTLTIIPHFSTHYNAIIAAALFFFMTFLTVSALVAGRFVVRVLYYFDIRTRKYRENVKSFLSVACVHSLRNGAPPESINHEPSSGSSNVTKETAASLSSKAGIQLDSRPLLNAFHRPFRRLVKTSVLISAILAFLYAHCWSRTLSAFKVSLSHHGAGAVCRAVFSPLSFGRWTKSGMSVEHGGADESCIWVVWALMVFFALCTYMMDEFAGKHYQEMPGRSDAGVVEDIVQQNDSVDEEDLGDILSEDLEGGHTSDHSWTISSSIRKFTHGAMERPQGTLAMNPWYTVLMFRSAFDILVSLHVFLGRFDARTMQPALSRMSATKEKRQNLPKVEDETEEREPHHKNSGCVFEYSLDEQKGGDGFWFDFMADCGDGFNSSYQVARLLAQPILSVKSRGGKKVLPRGSFLVIGGDLAYPDPTKENYEKRFFRTFEDAMSPPPSFRREHISTVKPALPVKGWTGCFQNSDESGFGDDAVQSYKGPCVFALPGNHDWFDGLATYTRYILSRDWLGGWLMPQQRSYFALKLPRGWWLFGFDQALEQDIDIEQFKFFARLAEQSVNPSDAVIVVTHEPHWVLHVDENRTYDDMAEGNLRELMHNHLKGKVRVRLAGDLHHYTRHVPAATLSESRRKQSVSHHTCLHGNASSRSKTDDVLDDFTKANDENQPELIVSGGGGAFLHPTHCFENRIGVGTKQEEYVRVCAYPNERVSHCLSWLNIWQFRWRNWRLDMVLGLGYFGVTSSLYPLCGIYEDYLQFNPSHHPGHLILWAMKSALSLLVEIFLTGRVSLFFAVAILIIFHVVTDSKLKPTVRLAWGLSHGIAHILAALTCLLFVQILTEWSMHEGIVKVSSSAQNIVKNHANVEGIDLASSLYNEYTAHFSHVLQDFAPINATFASKNASDVPVGRHLNIDVSKWRAVEELHASTYQVISEGLKWLYARVPLLHATLSIFDLPGNIAQKHSDICATLCAGGTECLLSNDHLRYFHLDRVSVTSYILASTMYLLIFAIPFAGNIFGTWLTLTLNVFKAQYNEGFSSLRLEHWKNFVKLHIKDNGDLEIFALGLHRVPKRWVKDPEWDGSRDSRRRRLRYSKNLQQVDDSPSWAWRRPSKWIPEKKSEKHKPEVIDYTCITKRNMGHHGRKRSQSI